MYKMKMKVKSRMPYLIFQICRLSTYTKFHKALSNKVEWINPKITKFSLEMPILFNSHMEQNVYQDQEKNQEWKCIQTDQINCLEMQLSHYSDNYSHLLGTEYQHTLLQVKIPENNSTTKYLCIFSIKIMFYKILYTQ